MTLSPLNMSSQLSHVLIRYKLVQDHLRSTQALHTHRKLSGSMMTQSPSNMSSQSSQMLIHCKLVPDYHQYIADRHQRFCQPSDRLRNTWRNAVFRLLIVLTCFYQHDVFCVCAIRNITKINKTQNPTSRRASDDRRHNRGCGRQQSQKVNNSKPEPSLTLAEASYPSSVQCRRISTQRRVLGPCRQ